MNKLVLLSFIVLLSGCFKTWDQLRSENQDPTPQRQTSQQQQAQQVAEKAPPTGYKFEEVDEQMRQLNGRLDALENQVSQINAAGTADKDNVNKLKETQDQKLLAYEEALKKLEAEVLQLRQDVDRLKQPPTPTKTPVAAAPGRTAYDEGEELFAAKKWRESIVAYQKYRDGNPKGRAYPDATYKMGVAFQELGMKDEARAFFEEVKEKFPTSKEAKKAALRMKSVK